MIADVSDTRLFYQTAGHGRPILLMHGGLGLDHTCFLPWLEPLADNRTQLVFYDHRGNGRSARPADWNAVTHATWADDADALRAHLGHERVVVFGHSYGGFLALEYALRHPDRVDGLILCGTAPSFAHFPDALARIGRRATPEQLRVFDTMLTLLDDDSLRAAWTTILPLYFRREEPEIGAALLKDTTFSAAAFNHVASNFMPTFNLEARLPEIQVPVLILVGRHDWVMPPDLAAQKLCDGLPDAEMVVFEESGHLPFIEEAEAFIDVVRRWMSSYGSARRAD